MAKKHKAAAPARAGEKKQGKIEIIGNATISACSKTGSKRLETWVRSYFRPEETLPSLEKQASVKETAANLLLFYFPYYILVFIMYAVSFYALGSTAQPMLGGDVKNPLDPVFAAGVIILEPLISTLNMLIVMFLVFVPAKLLGSKAGYATQSYAISSLFAGWMVLLAVIMAAATVELAVGSLFHTDSILDMALSFVVGFALLVTLIIGVAIFVYGIYQLYKIIKAVNGFSSLRAAATMVCATLLVVILNVALMYILGMV